MDLHSACDNAAGSDNSDDEMDEVYWKEDENSAELPELDCLFCNNSFKCYEEALLHCANVHNLDFKRLQKKFNMDCYAFIKMINYIRSYGTSAEKFLETPFSVWNEDIYLKPVKECDPWLILDFEEYLNFEPVKTFTSTDECEKLITHTYEQKLLLLQSQVEQKNQLIEELTERLSKMKDIVHKILQDEDTGQDELCKTPVVLSDNPYFESYSHPGIHYDMLSDKVRTQGYEMAIQNAPIVNKIVLDLGCGTGILSMFAAKQGAEKVYAVDNSNIIYYTMDIIRENKMEDKIETIKARIEDEPLPVNGVDIIVSEWMGYFLLFEGMLDSLIFARDRYLKPDGIMLPSSCNLFICGANDPEGHKEHIKFWTNVYGFQMSCIKHEVIKEAIIDVIPAEKIVTSVGNIYSFNLHECTVADTNFTSFFELTCNDDTAITTFVGYFDTIFNLENSSNFSTSPFARPTHWKQTLFHIVNPIPCKKGDILNGSITCRRGSHSNRSLSVTITVHNQNYVFDLSQ